MLSIWLRKTSNLVISLRKMILKSRSVSGQNYPTEPDYLAISKLAQATITNV